MCGQSVDRCFRAEKGEQESERSAQPPEHDAFGEKLADDAHVAGAQGRPNGKLTRAAH